MHARRPSQSCGRSFRQAKVPHFALFHQVRHGTYGGFDRRRGIHTVEIIEIDRLHAQPPETALTRAAHVVRLAVDPAKSRIGSIAHKTELGRQHDFVAPSAKGLADELLVRVRAVGVRSIEQHNAEIERAMDGCDRLAIVTARVELRHTHAAEPQRRNRGTAAS